MQRLVDDLLVLASHDTGHRRAHRLVSLSDIVADAVEDGRAIDRAAPMRQHPPRDTGDGRRGQLQQVIANLLANIRAHTPPGTCRHLDLRWSTTTWRSRSSTTDPGFLKHNKHESSNGSSARTRLTQRGGAGLGLAIVAAIVDEHDGTIGSSRRGTDMLRGPTSLAGSACNLRRRPPLAEHPAPTPLPVLSRPGAHMCSPERDISGGGVRGGRVRGAGRHVRVVLHGRGRAR